MAVEQEGVGIGQKVIFRPGKSVELGNQVAGKLKDLERNSYFFLYKSHILKGKFDILEGN